MGCPRNIELCGPFRHELYEDRRDVYIIRDSTIAVLTLPIICIPNHACEHWNGV